MPYDSLLAALEILSDRGEIKVWRSGAIVKLHGKAFFSKVDPDEYQFLADTVRYNVLPQSAYCSEVKWQGA